MAQNTPVSIVRKASTLSILWGVLLIIFGVVAIASPFLAAVAVNILIAWLIVLAGVVHIMLGVRTHAAGSMIWKLLVGLAYLFFGVYLIYPSCAGGDVAYLGAGRAVSDRRHPGHHSVFQAASDRGSTWVLVDGIVTLLLGVMIYMQWPSSSAWAIGTLVGMSMIISGVSRVMLSLAVRKATDRSIVAGGLFFTAEDS